MKPYNVYLSGDIFSSGHPVGGSEISKGIHELSDGEYRCVTVTGFEGPHPCESNVQAVRNTNLMRIMSSDLCVFHFDGTHRCPSASMGFIIAKMLDIPTVLVRSGNLIDGVITAGFSFDDDQWRLLMTGFPRILPIGIDTTEIHKIALRSGAGPVSMAKKHLTLSILNALNEVRMIKPVLSATFGKDVYRWVAESMGGNLDWQFSNQYIQDIVISKLERGLLL